MKRRNFFKTTALAGATLAVSPLNSCIQTSLKSTVPEDLSGFDLNEITIGQLQDFWSFTSRHCL